MWDRSICRVVHSRKHTFPPEIGETKEFILCFEWILFAWMTPLLGTEAKAYSGPCGTSAAASTEQFAQMLQQETCNIESHICCYWSGSRAFFLPTYALMTRHVHYRWREWCKKSLMPVSSPFWKKTCVMTVLQRGQGVLAGLFLASVLRQGSQKMWLQGWHM